MPKQTFFNLNKDKQDRIIHAAISEFSNKVYEQVNLSDIIRQSKIPRGSFYQYFQDKKDLYFHIIDTIKDAKMSYLKDIFFREDMKFLDLFKQLYLQGIKFAIDHPMYVNIFDKLLNNKNEIYDELMKESKVFAIQYYSNMINRDKEKGYLKKSIDTNTLARMVNDITINITLDELDAKNKDESYQKMMDYVNHLIHILKEGIETDE
mgnify:CR=1 FL=1